MTNGWSRKSPWVVEQEESRRGCSIGAEGRTVSVFETV